MISTDVFLLEAPSGKTTAWRTTVAVTALLAPMLAASPLKAQTTARTPVTEAETPAAADDIIVTAQKRAERLQDVPISISVIGGEQIKSLGAKSLAELQGVVPSVYVSTNNGFGTSSITVRGTGGGSVSYADDPVASYLDDVYLGRGSAIGASDLLDIGGVEVVRGPQGTLQGRNATAGAILLRSKDPSSTPEGTITAMVADPAEYRVSAAYGGPIGGDVRMRVAAGYTNERGWAYNPVLNTRLGGRESYQGRIVAMAGSGPVKIRATVDYSDYEDRPAAIRYAQTPFNPLPTGGLVPTNPLLLTLNTPLTPAELSRIVDDNIYALNRPNYSKVRGGGATLRATVDLGAVEAVSISAYRLTRIDAAQDTDGLDRTDREGFNSGFVYTDQYSQELRLQSTGQGPFSFILGLYGYTETLTARFRNSNLRYTGTVNILTGIDGKQETTSYAAFADATLRLSSNLSVIGGVRYTSDQKDINRTTVLTDVSTGIITSSVSFLPPTAKWTDVSYRGKIVFKPTEHTMIYASYSKGFKGGGFNLFGNEPAFNPETLFSAEVGAKADFLDGALSLSVAAYDNRYKNLQVRSGVPTGGTILTNAADSRIKGAEIEATIRPVEGLTLSGNASYTDAVFSSFPGAQDVFGVPTDASGNTLPRSPKWQYYLSGDYSTPIGQDWKVSAGVNYRYRSQIYFYHTSQDSPTYRGEPIGELGARIAVKNEADKYEVALFGSNLLNKRAVSNIAVAFSYPVASFNRPRVIGLQFRKDF